jgi:hypothetical protein
MTEFSPRWNIERDQTSGTLSVTTGSRQGLALPSGGTFQMDHSATASVADARPDGAKLEGATKIRLDLPASGVIEVETESWVSHDRILLTGSVSVAGRVICEKRWQR